ncbi:MAG: uracil-DNA glycosylase, partial [Candidatus Babeliales bacterium]
MKPCFTAEEKNAMLRRLYAPYINCSSCPLAHQGRTHVVFGHGNVNAPLFIIGEAPGKDEDLQGKPFVGRSGKLLDTIFKKYSINREQDLFITNIVKCRPKNNQKPTQHESNTCKNILLNHQIDIINPKVICTLGAAALEGLLEQPIAITQKRGRLLSYNNVFLVPTYHPAYILRNPRMLSTLQEDLF